LIGKAVKVAPQIAEFHNNLGSCMGRSGERRGGDGIPRRRRDSADYAEALNNLGAILGERAR
jgi:hypothetical protein